MWQFVMLSQVALLCYQLSLVWVLLYKNDAIIVKGRVLEFDLSIFELSIFLIFRSLIFRSFLWSLKKKINHDRIKSLWSLKKIECNWIDHVHLWKRSTVIESILESQKTIDSIEKNAFFVCFWHFSPFVCQKSESLPSIFNLFK